MVGSKVLKFIAEEFCLILGLYGKGHRIDYRHYGRSTFREEFFEGLRCSRAEIEQHLESLVKLDDADSIANFVRMLLTYMFVCFIFPTTNYSCPLALLYYLDDLDKIDTFSWGRAAHSFLMDHVYDSAIRVQKRSKGEIKDVGYLSGCSIALQVWFYERTSMEPNAYAVEPRILKWQGGKLFVHQSTRQKLIASIIDEQVIDELNVTTDFEKNLLGICIESETLPSNQEVKTTEGSCSGVGQRKKIRRAEMESEICALRELVNNLKVENEELKFSNCRLLDEVQELRKICGQLRDVGKGKNIKGDMQAQQENVEESMQHEKHTSEAVQPASEEHALNVCKKRKKIPTTVIMCPYTDPIRGKTFFRIRPYVGRSLLSKEDREVVDLFVRKKVEGGRSWSTQCNRSCITVEQINGVLYNQQIQDDVIDIYQVLVSEGVENMSSKAPCLFLSPFLTRKIKEGNIQANDALWRHLSNDTIKMARLLMMPLYKSEHWHLLVMNMESRKFESYSSIQHEEYHEHANICVLWVKRFLAAFPDVIEMSINEWPFEIRVDCPQQANILDCGIFVLKYEDCLRLGEGLNFSLDDVAPFRAEIALKILKELRILEDLTK